MVRRTRTALRKAILTGGVGLLLLAGHASAGPISSPGTFANDYEGDLVGGMGKLYFASTGMTKRWAPMRIQVQSFENGRWKRLGGRPQTSAGHPIKLVILNRGGVAVPCVSDVDPKNRARIRCHEGGAWWRIKMDRRFKGLTVSGMRARGGNVVALLSRWDGRGGSTVTRGLVGRLHKKTLRPVGPQFRIQGQHWPRLVGTTSGTRSGIEVGVKSAVRGRAWLLTLRGRKWLSSPRLKVDNWGALGSGAVRSGRNVFFPMNVDLLGAEQSTSITSVYRLSGRFWSQVGRKEVSHGTGYAQGGVYPVGRRVWAVWQETGALEGPIGSLLPTRVFAARVAPNGAGFERNFKVWEGNVAFPGPTVATAYRGRPVFLYYRQWDVDQGIHLTVDMSFVR